MYLNRLTHPFDHSRATSKECTPEYLDLWARRKGIHLIGSGDFTHPAWRRERVKRKIKARGRRILCAEKRIQDSGWEYAGSHDSPIRDHRRDQFYL